MGFFAEFKKFAMRGNVLDLAVGVIIGAAFGGVTKSMVDDVVMPPIGLALGKVDFKELYVPLDFSRYEVLKGEVTAAARGRIAAENEERLKKGEPPKEAPAEVRPSLAQAIERNIPTLRYGAFLNTCINFVIVAFSVFLLVKALMAMQKKEPPKPASAPELTTSEKLLAEIRDELKAKKGDPAKR
jgi:large conductance mechanosensitive channel